MSSSYQFALWKQESFLVQIGLSIDFSSDYHLEL